MNRERVTLSKVFIRLRVLITEERRRHGYDESKTNCSRLEVSRTRQVSGYMDGAANFGNAGEAVNLAREAL
jgi:hypothetical protein